MASTPALPTEVRHAIAHDRTALAATIQSAQQAGQRVVFTNGCFDILHVGHVSYLAEAKALGDILVVGVNSDASIRTLKGPERPINPIEHRLTMLAALKSVDWVIEFEEDTPIALLDALKPDVLVKGGDYTTTEVVGWQQVKAYGGEVKVLGVVDGVSTTNIVNTIRNSTTTIIKAP